VEVLTDPAPVRATVCGALEPAVTVRVADSGRVVEGVKVTLIVQLTLAARLGEQLFVPVKSLALAPEKLIPELGMESTEADVFVTVTVLLELAVFTC
jgi:hypothetical protein